jgi:hypothetical protein
MLYTVIMEVRQQGAIGIFQRQSFSFNADAGLTPRQIVDEWRSIYEKDWEPNVTISINGFKIFNCGEAYDRPLLTPAIEAEEANRAAHKAGDFMTPDEYRRELQQEGDL